MDFRSVDDIEKPAIHPTSSGHCKDSTGRQRGIGFSSFLLKHARCSLARLFRLLDVQAWRTNRQFVSGSRSRMRQPTAKVSCSIMTPQRAVAAGDAHLSEAIEDCIKFLNSSSKRSC
ncbi:uncharacterized protein LOC121996780 [Zingiber officinale]|uniref:uncharacterized protein LOC121996780 n=1 Tax=Zingiber officinale TaxID=94328 RepID=UPI001C4B64BD|nr:uncharacterized protein LOC121996780 [Zingiber officinale]